MSQFKRDRVREQHVAQHAAKPIDEHVDEQPAVAVGGLATVHRSQTTTTDPIGGTSAAPDVVSTLQRRQGQGKPLEPAVAGRFGEQFGTDLSAVRVHADREADTVARSVQATAFTHGNDIYFSQGSYAPQASAGQHLLAHELSHVVQQQDGRMAESSAGTTTIGRADDPAEVAAERSADQVVTALRKQGSRPPAGDTLAPLARHAAADAPVQRFLGFGKKKEPKAPSTEEKTTTGATAELGSGPTDKKAKVEVSPKERFETALGDAKAPGDKKVAKQRLGTLKQVVLKLSADERKTIWSDDALMGKTKDFLGPLEYMGFSAAIGMTHSGGTVAHKSGKDVDTLIKKYLGSRSHLKSFINSAVKAGKQAEGFVAVMDDANWNRVYEAEFPDEPVGSDEEQETNAFTSTSQSDSPIILNVNRGNEGTAVHEGMHRYQKDNLLEECGSDLNEGFTEYFTRMVTSHPDLAIDRDNYDDNIDFVRTALMPLLGKTVVDREKLMAGVYFGGKTSLLKAAFIDFRKKQKKESAGEAKKQWEGLLSDVRGDKWDEAKARCTA